MTYILLYLSQLLISWWIFQLYLSNCISSDDFFPTVSSSSAYLTTLPFLTSHAITFFLLYLLYLLISWWIFNFISLNYILSYVFFTTVSSSSVYLPIRFSSVSLSTAYFLMTYFLLYLSLLPISWRILQLYLFQLHFPHDLNPTVSFLTAHFPKKFPNIFLLAAYFPITFPLLCLSQLKKLIKLKLFLIGPYDCTRLYYQISIWPGANVIKLFLSVILQNFTISLSVCPLQALSNKH